MDARALVSSTKDLASLPEVAARVIGLIDDPDSTSADIEMVIAGDPNLAARVLKLANSAMYSVVSEVDTLSRAITVLGDKQILNLTLGISVMRKFDGIPNELVSMDDFWLHSVYCGIIARSLPEKKCSTLADAAFVAGLLHDIGQLIIFIQAPDQAREALLLSVEGPDDMSMVDAECAILGFDHTAVGAELAAEWQLPETLRECMEYHHQPDQATINPELNALVHISSCLAVLAEIDSTDLYEAPVIDPLAWEITKLNQEMIPEVLEQARMEFSEVKSLFLM